MECRMWAYEGGTPKVVKSMWRSGDKLHEVQRAGRSVKLTSSVLGRRKGET